MVCVSGPWARYWRITISVAAGAVVADIEANIKPKAIFSFEKGAYPPLVISLVLGTKSKAMKTNPTANNTSKIVMIFTALPVLASDLSLNSDPMLKAMNDKAISPINLRDS